jgi:hypothetical protein
MRQASVETQGGLAGAIARGAAAREHWFTSSELVPASALAERWSLTARALGAAAKRGEVLALLRGRRRYHPSEFLTLGRDVVSHICLALSGLSPETQLVFWKRTHGALGGKTVSDFLGRPGAGEEHVRRVVALAQAWTAESNGQ